MVLKHALYSEVAGDGPLDIEIRAIDSAAAPVRWLCEENPLLAVVRGGTLERVGDRPTTLWRLECADTTTDAEHDTSRFLAVNLCGMTLADIEDDGGQKYIATLHRARLWPEGVDPSRQGDLDTVARPCDREDCTFRPHLLAAYQPPERSEVNAALPLLVAISVRAHR